MHIHTHTHEAHKSHKPASTPYKNPEKKKHEQRTHEAGERNNIFLRLPCARDKYAVIFYKLAVYSI